MRNARFFDILPIETLNQCTMFLSNLLRRIREKNERKDILRTLIESLRIDENQRFLYLESLELLDDDGLATFYARLVTFVDEKECGNIISE